MTAGAGSAGLLFRAESARLRPYQDQAIAQLRRHVGSGMSRILLVLPTGGGKTLTATSLMRSLVERGCRVLFVVHLRELVDQTVRALERCGLTDLGVMRGDDGRTNPDAPIQIASIQTLARRKRPAADTIILDEAHRSLSESYSRCIFDAPEYTEAVIVGLTATPCRTDARPLGERYQAMVVGATYSDLIADGFINAPIVFAPREVPDLSHVRRIGGDWDEGEIERVMARLAGNIVPTWLANAGGRTTVVFASGVNHSKDIAERFRAAGVDAEHLDGETPAHERADRIARLRSGRLKVLTNCAVLTEGFDAPEVRCAVIARPTLSLVLHMQTAGRALRPGAVQPMIIDHANNVARHGMPHEDRVWSLEGKAVSAVKKNPWKTCGGCFAYILIQASICPYCGFEAPKVERELPEEVDAPMVKVDGADLERSFYMAKVETACRFGMKPGSASFKFKERFGKWPPWAWSQATKADFEADPGWRMRVERRQQERETRERGDGEFGGIGGDFLSEEHFYGPGE